MSVLYDGPYGRITHEVVALYGPGRRSYAVRELARIYVVPGTATRRRSAVRVCFGGASGMAVVVITLNRAIDTPRVLAFVVALAVLVFSAVAFGASWCLRVTPHELWAEYRGDLVCLFRTTDEQTFGQVKRALLRAREYYEDTP
jgi:hypothetical protein